MQSKKITDKDTFTFNESFKAKLRRLKINAIQMKETVSVTALCRQLAGLCFCW